MMTGQIRDVSLTPELDDFISEQVASGRYADTSAVVRAALKVLRDKPRC